MTPLGLPFLLLFLPAAVLVARATASRERWRTPALVLLGLVYYALVAGAWPLALLIGMTIATYAATSAARRRPSRPGLVVLGAVAPLSVLAAFKLAALVKTSPGSVLLPLGLSFYAFNLASYAFDVRQGLAPAASLPSLAAFSTFFPSVTAGPLLRYGHFHAQEAARPPVGVDLVHAGMVRLILGLAKKTLVADPLGAAIEPLFSSYESLGLDAWIAVLGYAYQLYFDFSGYTDMAIGAGALLGFRLPENFNAPYAALHITDFWQRWHMTMSQWFRDYLFLPLSRALLRRSPSTEGADGVRARCLVLTMVVIGLWHGTTWSYLAWGGYHGVLLAGHARIRRARSFSLPAWASRALTFVAVLAGWVLLRSPSPGMAARLWAGMAGVHGLGTSFRSNALLVGALVALLVATNVSVPRRIAFPRLALPSWALAALLVLSLLSMGAQRPFLYFQF
jgi:alginate O-acetyltransferase complex protein AlgI